MTQLQILEHALIGIAFEMTVEDKSPSLLKDANECMELLLHEQMEGLKERANPPKERQNEREL